MRTSFTLRLTFRFALLVTLATAGMLGVGAWLLQRETHNRLLQLHEIEAAELAALLGRVPLAADDVKARVDAKADSDAVLFLIQVHNAAGEVLYRSDNLGPTILPPEAGRSDRTLELPAWGRVLLSSFAPGPWRIEIASRLDPSDHLLRDYLRVSTFLLIVMAVTSTGLGYGFARYTMQPVRAIEATARRIRADNLSERIAPLPGHGELTALIELLNATFDRLQAAFEQVRRFTADASHELKTPLSLARLSAEKLAQRVGADPESATLATDILDEIARLNRVIENLLFLAKSESGALQVARRPLATAEFVRDFAEDATALAEDRGLVLAVPRNDPGWIGGEPGLLRQLLLNLVSNAIAVSPPGGRIDLTAAWLDGHWRITVQDEGPGLPPNQLARVFERFARFEGAADSPARPGTGLGLAIGRSIAELHGGRLVAENRTDRRGLRVTLALPATG